jgi:hypothetical protein
VTCVLALFSPQRETGNPTLVRPLGRHIQRRPGGTEPELNTRGPHTRAPSSTAPSAPEASRRSPPTASDRCARSRPVRCRPEAPAPPPNRRGATCPPEISPSLLSRDGGSSTSRPRLSSKHRPHRLHLLRPWPWPPLPAAEDRDPRRRSRHVHNFTASALHHTRREIRHGVGREGGVVPLLLRRLLSRIRRLGSSPPLLLRDLKGSLLVVNLGRATKGAGPRGGEVGGGRGEGGGCRPLSSPPVAWLRRRGAPSPERREPWRCRRGRREGKEREDVWEEPGEKNKWDL